MFQKLLKFLNEPFPDSDDLKHIIRDSAIVGGIVFLVLALYAPFGLDELESGLYLNCLLFGLISFVCSVVYELFLRKVLSVRKEHPSWTLLKWIVSTLGLLIFIALGNYLFAVYSFQESHFALKGFVQMIYQTFVVGIIPVSLFAVLTLNRQTRINTEIASDLLQQEPKVIASEEINLPIKDSQKVLTLDVSKIVFAEAMRNYVLVYRLDDGNQLQRSIHRNTFSSVLEILEPHGFHRTHRSFLVNSSMISGIDGNAQGLKLSVQHYPEGYIPVSRKYVPLIRHAFEKG